jgi:hypothetical protein
VIQKFAGFRKEGVDTLAVQLQGVDLACRKAERKENDFSIGQGRFLFMILAHDLEKSDDNRALAKLPEASKSADPQIAATAAWSVKKADVRRAGDLRP